MPVALIVQLLTTFGPSAVSLITGLIATWEGGGTITAAQWTTLTASLTQTATNKMTAALTAAGIDPTSTQGQTLLSMTK